MSRRPCDQEWIRDVLRQCQSSGTAFFLKQTVADGKIDKSSMLDGQEWRQFPAPKASRELDNALPAEAKEPSRPVPKPASSDFTLMSSITPQPVQWLWEGRLPLGELTIIDGDPGTSKSSVILDLVARASNATAMPDGTKCPQCNSLLLVGEDSISKTLPHRLKAAAANMERVAVINRAVVIPRDLPAIERAAIAHAAKMIVIDPLFVFLGRNANSDQAVRQALSPLREFAERTHSAVVMIRHLNKSGGRAALYRGSGSIGIIAATRSAFLVAKDPKDENMRVLLHTKNNLGPLAPTLLFEPVSTTDGSVRIEWRGESEYAASDLLAPGGKNSNSKLDEAMRFLTEMLIAGPAEHIAIEKRAAELAIAFRTVERAKKLLGIISRRDGFGPGSVIYWELPNSDPA